MHLKSHVHSGLYYMQAVPWPLWTDWAGASAARWAPSPRAKPPAPQVPRCCFDRALLCNLPSWPQPVAEGPQSQGWPWYCVPSLSYVWVTSSALVPDQTTGSQARSRVSSLDMWLPEAAVAPPPPAASPAGPLPQHEVAFVAAESCCDTARNQPTRTRQSTYTPCAAHLQVARQVCK